MRKGLELGLPEELVDFEAIAKETSRIRVRVEKRKFGRPVTVITGFDKSVDLKALAKKLKRRLACGGTVKEDSIELMGDHRRKVKDVLAEEGFPEDQILVE